MDLIHWILLSALRLWLSVLQTQPWKLAMKDYQNPEVQIQVLIEYMMVMIARRDWHGVSDAANDIRELEAEQEGPNFLRRSQEHA
jgi:hypothetical protein